MITGFSIFRISKFHLQALYASTSISTGMKGATKAMVAMNKVCFMLSRLILIHISQNYGMHFFCLLVNKYAISLCYSNSFPWHWKNLKIYASLHFHPTKHLKVKESWTQVCHCQGSKVSMSPLDMLIESYCLIQKTAKLSLSASFCCYWIKSSYIC